MATVSLEGTQFGAPGNHEYQKVMAGLDIQLRPDKMINPIRQSIRARYILASDLYQIENLKPASLNPYVQLGYNVQKTGLINPFNLLISAESGPSYQKATVDFDYQKSYVGRANGLEIRAFAGTMIHSNPTYAFYGLAPSARSGRDLYLYDGTYPDRFSSYPTSFFSRQMTVTEGGLVSPVNEKLGYSKWLVSLSLSSSLPGKAGKLGIKPFVNVLLNDHSLGPDYNSLLFGEAGIKVGLWNLFEIHIPLLVTGNVQSITGSINNRIRIVFNLDLSKQGKIGIGN